MIYKENVKVEPFVKRRGGKVYRDVTFFVKGGCVRVQDILTNSDESAYIKAKDILQKAIEL